jgi:PAS domain-containing protein
MARRWAQAEANQVVWEVDATTHLAESAAGQAVSLITPDGLSRWLHPVGGNEFLVSLNHRLDPGRAAALDAARVSTAPAVSGTLDLPPLGRGFTIYAPIFRDGQIWRYVAVEYLYGRLFGTLVERLRLAGDYEIRISVGDELLYDSTGFGVPPSTTRAGLDPVFTLFDRRVRLSLVTSDEFFRRNRRFIPELALAAGFGITLLLGLSVHLARAAYTSLRTAEISNRRLVAENEERRRVEAMLKVSDECLRLALDSTQLGVFEWNLASNQVYYSPGLWSMLGYAPDAIGSTPGTWTALIDPDDLATYRDAVESQLSGRESFIEPEYRVRTGAGSTTAPRPSPPPPPAPPPASSAPSRTSPNANSPKPPSANPRPPPANSPSSPPARTTWSSSAPPRAPSTGSTNPSPASWNTPSRRSPAATRRRS